MQLQNEFNSGECPTIEIVSYVDSELSPDRELEFELHLKNCQTCREELQLQRQFLSTLNSNLTGNFDVELPPDFAKRIVTNAESSVTGLRKPVERFNAVFICAALMLMVLFALGSDAFGLFAGIRSVFEKAAAVAGLAGHVAVSILVGVGVVLRPFSGQLQAAALAMMFFAVAFAVLIRFSRSLFGLRRT